MTTFKDLTNDTFGKSLRVLQTERGVIDALFSQGYYEIPSDETFYPNQPLILKNGQQSAMGFVDKWKDRIVLAREDIGFFGIHGRNKEQILLQHLMNDPDIRCIVVTGPAGTGKTTLIGSYALDQVFEKGNFESMILSKPLEIVTRSRYWGTMPGDENEKFGPFLKSYLIMFENMAGGNHGNAFFETAVENGAIDFMPLELMRGATLRDAVVWYDEAQNLNHKEMQTLGSRLDDRGDSKLILSGDLGQRDRNISREHTGLMKLTNSPSFLNSSFTAHVDLIQNERGVLSQLFYDVFEKDED